MSLPHPIPSGTNPKEKGRAPEGCGQKEVHMLNVAEKADKASLLKRVGSEYITQSPDKRAATWLDTKVAESQSNILSFVSDLTPALAGILLSRNTANRKVKQGIVDRYSRDISNGAWQLNGEPLIISKSGQLNNGQHRCRAVVDANQAIPVLFVFGVERETRTTLDQGAVRTVGDYLGMNGYVNTLQLAAAASYIWQYKILSRISAHGGDKPTKSEVLDFVDEHPNIIESVNIVMQKGSDAVGGKSILAFCHWVFAQRAGKAAAKEFIEGLITGVGLPAKHPILYCRNRLISERGRLRPHDKGELIFRAWNAYRRNELIRSLVIAGGTFPKLEK